MSAARSVFSTILLLIGIVASVITVPAAWAYHQLSTEAYLETGGPVLDDPRVRKAIAERGADVALDKLGIGDDKLAETVRPQLATALDTPPAHRAWEDALRAARNAVAEPRTGGAIVVDLAPVLNDARKQFLRAGLPLPTEVPTTKVTLLRSSGLEAANHWYHVLAPLAVPLVVVTVALLLLAVLVAPRHSGMLAAAGIGVAVAMLCLVLASRIAESPAVGLLESAGAPSAFAEALYQAYAGSLRSLALWVLGGGVVAFVIGLIASVINRPSSSKPSKGRVNAPEVRTT